MTLMNRNKQRIAVSRIAEIVEGTLEGDGSVTVTWLASLEEAGPDEVTFADEKRLSKLADCAAGAAIVSKKGDVPAGISLPLIRVENVSLAIARLLAHFQIPEDLPPVGVDARACVSPDAQLGKDVRIGPGAVVGARAKIGDRSVLLANAVVESDAVIGEDVLLREGVVIGHDCQLGRGVIVGANSVIGGDGFGYNYRNGVHHKVPHLGNVVLEDEVEIGACSCVDRAKFGSTRIGAGTKIDNLVQIAHNVQTGRGCLMAALVGIAGSTKLGDYVVLGGHVGLRDNITIGDGAQVAAYSACSEDVPAGKVMFGIPAIAFREKYRQISCVNQLPELYKKIEQLEMRLKTLESSEND